MTDPLREDVTALPCRELLSSISFRISCHPRKRIRKIEKGKKTSEHKRKKTHQIFDISSPPEYELSLLFLDQSVARVLRSEKKKNKETK